MSFEDMTEEGLALVARLARDLRRKVATINDLEERLARENEDLRQIEEQRIPAAMAELGLKSLELADGAKLTVGAEYHASIPKAKQQAAMQWLRDNGLGDVIKNVVSIEFGRDQDELARSTFAYLNDTQPEQPIDLKESVHTSTLKALVKEQFEAGTPMPEETFGIHIIDRAKIKERK